MSIPRETRRESYDKILPTLTARQETVLAIIVSFSEQER
jgi:hypothetical protein